MSDLISKEQIHQAFVETLNKVLLHMPEAKQLFTARLPVTVPALLKPRAGIPLRVNEEGTATLSMIGILNGILAALGCPSIYGQFFSQDNNQSIDVAVSDTSPMFFTAPNSSTNIKPLTKHLLVAVFPGMLHDIDAVHVPHIKYTFDINARLDQSHFFEFMKKMSELKEPTMVLFDAHPNMISWLMSNTLDADNQETNTWFCTIYPNSILRQEVIDRIKTHDEALARDVDSVFDFLVRWCRESVSCRIEMVKNVDLDRALDMCLTNNEIYNTLHRQTTCVEAPTPKDAEMICQTNE